MVSINVPIKGVKTLEIEVNDGGNGNTADHGLIANPKLTTNNAKPTLSVEETTLVKLNTITVPFLESFKSEENTTASYSKDKLS